MLLRCCVYSLLGQTVPVQVIVCDNSPYRENVIIEAGVLYLHTATPGNCYDVADVALKYCLGEFLCFPSDDSYYMPIFAEIMERRAVDLELDLVYCNMVYDKRLSGKGYSVLNVAPAMGIIDKTGFILRKSRFSGFPQQQNDFRDGALVDQLVASGIKHGKINDILVVHN